MKKEYRKEHGEGMPGRNAGKENGEEMRGRKTVKECIMIPMLALMLFVGVALASAQQLRVDSVAVDTTWSSDSSWYDNQGLLQQRYGRDLYLSFTPRGNGTARCSVLLSLDSAKSWAPSPNPLTVLDNGISSSIPCGTRGRVKLRVFGQDRPGCCFRVNARQSKPVIAGSPKLTSLTGNLTPGATCNVNLQCKQDASQDLGAAPIAKVWWGLPGGTWSDSTTALSWTWNTTVPAGSSGQQRQVIAKARDVNGLWSAPCTLTVQFGSNLITMVSIPAGSFLMGSLDTTDFPNSIPRHQVTLSAFLMSQTPVTQGLYQTVMDTNPGHWKNSNYPIDQISWYDAIAFCNKLSKLEGLDTVYSYADTMNGEMDSLKINYAKNGYRMPTEAEWEYAYRAGTTTDYYWGKNYPPKTHADTVDLNANAVWFGTDSLQYANVGTKLPNAWGLYDMAGNVFTWCNDFYADDYSDIARQTIDPTGPATGYEHVTRGGSWGYFDCGNIATFPLTAEFRGWKKWPYSSGWECGLRVVRRP